MVKIEISVHVTKKDDVKMVIDRFKRDDANDKENEIAKLIEEIYLSALRVAVSKRKLTNKKQKKIKEKDNNEV